MRAEHGRLEDVGPGVDQVGGRTVGGRLLDELEDAAVVVGGDHSEAGRVGHRLQVDRGGGPVRAVEGDECGGVEVGQDVAVHDQEGLVDRRVPGCEGDGPGGVEGLGLDRVVEADTGRLVAGIGGEEGVGAVPEGQDDLVDAVRPELAEDALEHRHFHHGQELLRRRVRERAESRPLAAQQDDGLHFPGATVESVVTASPSSAWCPSTTEGCSPWCRSTASSSPWWRSVPWSSPWWVPASVSSTVWWSPSRRGRSASP